MNYLEAEKILRKNLSPLPRTYSEAVKDADYATAIWRCETEWDRTKDWLLGAVVIGVLMSLFASIIYGLIVWIDLWKS
jgi:hypothetical protein